MDNKTWKIVAATCTVIGLFLGFLELYFRPSVLLLESSHTYPDWAKWFRLLMTSIAPIAYIVLDYFEHKKTLPNKIELGVCRTMTFDFEAKLAR